MENEINELKTSVCDLRSELADLRSLVHKLMGNGVSPTSHIRIYTQTQSSQTNTELDAVAQLTKSYKHPDLSFVTREIISSLFDDHKEKLPYKLFRYIYFSVDVAANKTIKMPEKMTLNPRNINVCDYGDWHKAPAADVLIEINRIVCELINVHLTKGEIYDKMSIADKLIIGDAVCGRFDKKITQETIKNYMSALY